jgi:multiple sugar transport system permease protein
MKNKFSRLAAWAFSLCAVFAVLFPFVWMVLSSFKNKQEILAVPLVIFPSDFDFGNYLTVIHNDKYPIFQTMFVTFLVAVSAVALSLLINTMAGYTFARLDFKFKKFLWALCISTMFIPGIAILITSFVWVNRLHMLNTFWVLLLPGLASGGSTFFYRQFFLNMPNSLEDAALIDGCGRFRIFWNIYIPLSTAPITVSGAGIFLVHWNAYMWPTMTITNPRLMQVMQVVRSYRSFYGDQYGYILAAICIMIIPPLILFFIFQKRIVEGVVLSGIK